MALTSLQKDVMAVIAANRSDTSYMAGGAVLNENWFRLSDDLHIFRDTDEEIVATAQKDMAALTDAGFKVNTDVLIYGVVEWTVSRGGDATILQWMSETRYRYFPLVRDAEWGVRLNTADLAINKVGAASTRTKARDYVDLVTIDERFSPSDRSCWQRRENLPTSRLKRSSRRFVAVRIRCRTKTIFRSVGCSRA